MPNFDSGVCAYVKGVCTIEVNFPVDKRGYADVSCNQCPYYARNSHSCLLNRQVVNYPEKYIGVNCPLTIGEIEGEVPEII